MDRNLKLFFAVFLGALSGFFLGAQLGHSPYFAWVATIVGGLTGYFSYQFRKVIAAVPKAWRATAAWRPFSPEFRTRLRRTFLMSAAVTTVASNLILLLSAEMADEATNRLAVFVLFFSGGMLFAFIFSFLYFFSLLFTAEGIGEAKDDLKFLKTLFTKGNPFAVFLYWPIRGLIWAITRIPAALSAVVAVVLLVVVVGTKVVLHFLRYLFVLIHSDSRLIAGYTAAIFATVNYFEASLGMALTVATAAGLFGLGARYAIAKRILGLEPNGF